MILRSSGGAATADAHRAVVAVVEVLQLHFQLAVRAAAYGLLDPRSLAGKARHGDAGEVASPQTGIEGEEHFVPEGEISLGPPRLDARALDEAEVTEVVRRAVAAGDDQGRLARPGKLRVLGDEDVEGHLAAALRLAEDAEMAGE